MTTKEVADRLVSLCRKGEFEEATKELYGHNCVSIEPSGGPWPERVEGIEAIGKKGETFESMVEAMHGVEIESPIVAGNHFSIKMAMDITYKGQPRAKNEEICLYEVADGKIVQEQFFYKQ